MVFSSAIFLFAFLPACFLLYQLMPGIRTKNGLLCLFSLVFYAFGQLQYLPLLLASVLINYSFGRLLGQKPSFRKGITAAAVALNLAVLGGYKYLGFAVETLESILGVAWNVTAPALPIGISFFTFQGLSYVIDVSRDDTLCCRSPWKLLLYISLFPQLIAGPIVKYHDVAGQLDSRTVSALDAAQGLRRFILGLAKKLLVANTVGAVADAVFALNTGDLSCPLAWLGAVGYTLQIYFDFSGYSDMALGLGRMFGFHFLENFKHPYAAGTITEFWRRWHISLSAWFRDYLYIPLGGNRAGTPRTWRNKLLVFFCTGLWHGANWTFVLWGLWHGAFASLETVAGGLLTKLNAFRAGRAALRIYTLLVVILGFVLFRAATVGQALAMASAMFSGGAGTLHSARTLAELLTGSNLTALLLGCILALPVLPWLQERTKASGLGLARAVELLTWPACLALLVLCILSLAGSAFNPFIYFQF